MFRRKIKSALFVDFDNVVSLLTREFASSIPKWLAWLEDGRFDEDSRKRTLLQKRVYWNSPNEVHRSAFEREGFEAVMCPSRVRVNKSAADVIIALDALQSTYEAPEIQEYIILTTDTDFVPLLEKLADRSKKTVAAANEKNLVIERLFGPRGFRHSHVLPQGGHGIRAPDRPVPRFAEEKAASGRQCANNGRQRNTQQRNVRKGRFARSTERGL